MKENVTIRRTKQTDRTQAELTTALFLLLQQYPLERITIDQLCQKAGYSRRTFYRHFHTTKEIVQVKLNKVVKDMFDNIQRVNHPQPSYRKTVVAFFKFWQKHLSLLTLLSQQKIFYLLPQTATNQIQFSLLGNVLVNDPDANYIQSFAVAGMFALLEQWLENDCQASPEQMGIIASKIQNYL